MKQNQRNITFFTLMQLPLANEPLFRNNPKCRPRTLVLYSGMHENEKKAHKLKSLTFSTKEHFSYCMPSSTKSNQPVAKT